MDPFDFSAKCISEEGVFVSSSNTKNIKEATDRERVTRKTQHNDRKTNRTTEVQEELRYAQRIFPEFFRPATMSSVKEKKETLYEQFTKNSFSCQGKHETAAAFTTILECL